MEAVIIMQKCSKKKAMFGVRVEKMSDGDWWRTWAFPMKETQARNEGYDKNSVRGNMYATEDFPGCPYCESTGFVQCGICKKLTCWNGESSMDCGWCGKKMNNIVVSKDGFELSGGKF